MRAIWIVCLHFFSSVRGHDSARRLFDDLLTHYNRLVRPVRHHNQTLQVRLNLKLSQLLDVHEKDQIMTINVWLHQEWIDHKMIWTPADYGGIETIYVPANLLWRPDLVLYNTADGNYEVKIITKAMVRFDGLVTWEPPAVFRSVCEMNVMWFPLDEQRCKMKIGSWTYDGFMVDLIHYHNISEVIERRDERDQTVWLVERAIDLSSYYPSVEWDIMAVPGERHFLFYPCCEAPFVDITYYISLRRKTLFYTVNLIIPCVGISFLTVFVFYLPANSGEKIVMCISILISLNVFLLLLVELIPSTSLAMPLIARYLLFTMILVTLSVAVTVFSLSIHYRAPTTHTMPPWIRRWLLRRLPRLLGIKPLKSRLTASIDVDDEEAKMKTQTQRNLLAQTKYGAGVVIANNHHRPMTYSEATTAFSTPIPAIVIDETADQSDSDRRSSRLSPDGERDDNDNTTNPPEVVSDFTHTFTKSGSRELLEARLVHEVWERRQSLFPLLEIRETSRRGAEAGDRESLIRYGASCIALIAHKVCRDAQEKEIQQDWSYVGMVIDRVFLYIFGAACVIGTILIIFQAPSLYDTRQPLT